MLTVCVLVLLQHRHALQVIAKDSNVLLVAQAANCLTGLARGLRKNYLTYATNVSTVFLLSHTFGVLTFVSASAASALLLGCGIAEIPLNVLIGGINRRLAGPSVCRK